MVGSGTFALPAAFGRATGVVGALIAWSIAGAGMLMLTFVSRLVDASQNFALEAVQELAGTMDAGCLRGHRCLAGEGGGTDLSRRDAELVAKGPGEA